MKKTASLLLLLLLALCATLFVRAMLVEPPQREGNSQPVTFAPDTSQAVDHLAQAISFRTVSADQPEADRTAFSGFQTFLERSYPAVHSATHKTVINRYSQVHHWPGSNENLKPILLLAHYDVVSAVSHEVTDWRYPPFAGTIAEGHIWGRGAQDNKGSLIAIMEALSALVREGYQPQRSIYIAFGHDEETGGSEGAKQIASYLQGKNLQFEFILDEGSMIAVDMLPQLKNPIAVIGPAEKGQLTLKLSASAPGGHASMPPAHTAVGRVAGAVTRLEENPFPIDRQLSRAFFDELLPHMPFHLKILFANHWLFDPFIDWLISNKPALNAGVRTTVAATMISGGSAENALPVSASAIINVRILPGDSIASVTDRIKDLIDDDQVRIETIGTASEPSAVSNTEGSGYRLVRRTVHQVSGKQSTIVAPRLVVAATDARHYSELSEQILRFLYIPVTPDSISGLHGPNERIAIDDLANAIQFYYQLIRNADKFQ